MDRKGLVRVPFQHYFTRMIFFTDSLDSLGEKKDDYMQLQGNVIIELGELSSMNKTKIEQIKTSSVPRSIKLDLLMVGMS